MLFNSLAFAAFLPIVFCLYWLLRRHLRAQNALVLVASYVFYGWWDWRFLSLIVLSSAADYVVGRQLARTDSPRARGWLLGLSLLVNLGMLGVFKYYDFFVQSITDSLQYAGVTVNLDTLSIILPLGISFYTFQTLSYTIDVYRRRIDASDDPVAFFSFVAFFPQLVAGPIERASQLLPQFGVSRQITMAGLREGARQALWGMFKKVAIADSCAPHVNAIFEHHAELGAPMLVLGALFFAFQIYCDFSGYSDIAIGVSRMFGFELMANFRYPYFSRDIAEFWRRWHISLSTWFRDYLYIPLGGSRGTTALSIRNTFIIFVVSGLWHGANATFVVWGALNALYFLPLLLTNRNRRHLDDVPSGGMLPPLRPILQMATTFSLTCLAWVFFRAPTVTEALAYIGGLARWSSPVLSSAHGFTLALIGLLVAAEWVRREHPHPNVSGQLSFSADWIAQYALVVLILLSLDLAPQQFIYFQF